MITLLPEAALTAEVLIDLQAASGFETAHHLSQGSVSQFK
ncbi:hypothetical protein C4K04_5489 [Pseudomonas chlororaphis]|uniref:Uncharacterized protein n=1 Tax=Pseudomonas chlororaphis TaxID=587753 RepID=A0A3G7TY48_9PSED|nr:hypothetical protein C4K04_5489 [Pseudomonas chlororaphis]